MTSAIPARRAAPHGDGGREPDRTEVQAAPVVVAGELEHQIDRRVQGQAEDEQPDGGQARGERADHL